MTIFKIDLLYYFSLLIFCFISTILARSYVTKKSKTSVVKYAPSPLALPFIGHIHLLGPILHISFQNLARKYGPLMHLKIGSSQCLIASSASVAKDIMKDHDLIFSSRPEFDTSGYNIYSGSSFFLAEYGDYWRFMKKLCMTKLLGTPQLNSYIGIRWEEVQGLIQTLTKSYEGSKRVDMGVEFTTMTNNMICRMVMSKTCLGTSTDAEECIKLVGEVLDLAGKMRVGDILGPLKKFDLFGYGKRLGNVLEWFDTLMEKIMKEHEESDEIRERKDIMDMLLEIYRDPTAEVKLTRRNINSFILELFMAGTDTSSEGLQWALAELINNPKVFNKLRKEIDTVTGKTRLIEESDVPNLPYLQAVIKETLRVHPPGPLILRKCREDCTINGFQVKKETRMLINIYTVMRDPEAWKDPESFIPERFLSDSDECIGEHQMEMKGMNFRFIPFGSGRRGCPGASLVLNVMHTTIGAMVQCFDFPHDECKVDLEEGSGFSTTLKHPLMCNPVPRPNLF